MITVIIGDDEDDDDDAIHKLVDVCDKVVKMALTTSVNMKNIAICEQSDSSDSDLETTQETKLKVRCYLNIIPGVNISIWIWCFNLFSNLKSQNLSNLEEKGPELNL